MNFEFDGINVNYFDNKNDKQPIVLLHGWGQNIDVMMPVADEFLDSNRIVIVDFPGFGLSDEPKGGWDVDKYVEMLESLLTHLEIANPIIIGHSFGCRVAIKYSVKNPVLKMVFTGGAGIRPKRGLSYYLKVYSYKLMKLVKKLPFVSVDNTNYGSEDYRNASEELKKTFVKIVNEDLTPLLSQIKCPVLLIWGKNDEATPLSDGKKMESLINDSALIELRGSHYAYLENISYFNVIVKEFVK